MYTPKTSDGKTTEIPDWQPGSPRALKSSSMPSNDPDSFANISSAVPSRQNSFPFWLDRDWIQAEHDYPEDYNDTGFCCFKPSATRALVYDNETNKFDTFNSIRDMNLHSSQALFSKLPSRTAKVLKVFIEANTPSTSSCAPRFRLTKKETARDMTLVCKIPLENLKWQTRLLILLGKLEWIFVVNLPKQYWG